MTDTVDPTSARAAYTAGLRALADALDASPDLPLPYPRATAHVSVYQPGAGIDAAAAVVRTPGRWEKGTDESLDRFTLTQRFGPVAYLVSIPRAAVCERRTVTKTVEEWVCPESLLATDDAALEAVRVARTGPVGG